MSGVRRTVTAGAVVLASLLLASCGGASDPEATPPASRPTAAPDPTAALTVATTVPPATTIVAATTAVPPTTAVATTAPTSSTTPTAVDPADPADPADVDPGSLPQTRALPAASGPLLDAHVQALWHAVVTDDPDAAMPFFFPRSAYLTVKAIADPAGDYERRLVTAYAEDIHALHTRLGADATRAVLGPLIVPAAAQWIDPGVEYNAIGYWRVYGATVSYTLAGRRASMPIASMISWRGQWYVVHLSSIR